MATHFNTTRSATLIAAMVLAFTLTTRASVDDAQSFALQAAEPYVKEGFQVREDYWGGDLGVARKKAVRQQLFKGNEYWFWLGTEVEKATIPCTSTIRKGNWRNNPTVGRKDISPPLTLSQRHRKLLHNCDIEESPEERTHWAFVYGFR